MKSLRSLHLDDSYRSDTSDIARDFLAPALAVAEYYDRAVGYFNSGSLTSLARGISGFVENSGIMRLVASPQLDDDDVVAIRDGYSARDAKVFAALENAVQTFLEDLTAYPARALTWLIASNRLAIKIAIPTAATGIYHEKIGILSDLDDSIAFVGSANETFAGLSSNFESLDVYRSWMEPDRVVKKRQTFERLWRNETANVNVIDFPEALRRRLIDSAPKAAPTQTDSSECNALRSTLELRDYQSDAVDAWLANGMRGIFEMATGTGKTITALAATQQAIDRGVRAVVIQAPLKHLVEQWTDTIASTLRIAPIVCSSDYDWRPRLLTDAARARVLPDIPPIIVVSTYATARTDDFQSAVSKLPPTRLMIADEMHNITADDGSVVLRDDYEARLGLSATPHRYMDDIGTEKLLSFFHGVVSKFTIADAIARGFLTPYDYFPIICRLTDTESAEYAVIVSEFSRLSQTDENVEKRSRFAAMLAKRHSLIQRAHEKLQKFEDLIREGPFNLDAFNLVYTHPELLEIVQRFIGREMKYRAHRFTARESIGERRDILERFSRGEYTFLTAIRCLDEGIDIPPTRTAFLLNSSQNPKEFIQRRGRVLRPWPGKTAARIYDFIVLPLPEATTKFERLVEQELARFAEFANIARNRQEALETLSTAAGGLGLALDLAALGGL